MSSIETARVTLGDGGAIELPERFEDLDVAEIVPVQEEDDAGD